MFVLLKSRERKIKYLLKCDYIIMWETVFLIVRERILGGNIHCYIINYYSLWFVSCTKNGSKAVCDCCFLLSFCAFQIYVNDASEMRSCLAMRRPIVWWPTCLASTMMCRLETTTTSDRMNKRRCSCCIRYNRIRPLHRLLRLCIYNRNGSIR